MLSISKPNIRWALAAGAGYFSGNYIVIEQHTECKMVDSVLKSFLLQTKKTGQGKVKPGTKNGSGNKCAGSRSKSKGKKNPNRKPREKLALGDLQDKNDDNDKKKSND